MKLRPSCALVCAASLAVCGVSLLHAQSAAFHIDRYVLASAGAHSHNSCFLLDGTAGEPASGYSSNSTFAILAGFRAAAPQVVRDELFFSSFEGC
jgi:hypothetical protein